MPPNTRRTYHHGSAKVQLVESARMLLAEQGAAGLSLRAVAQHAGLSHQAPYNHFADKQELLAELVRDGYERLATELQSGPQDGPKTRRRRLLWVGQTYITFAARERALFRLMFSRELVDVSGHPEAASAAGRAYGVLVDLIGELAPAGKAQDLAVSAWSLVHGYATLVNETGLDEGRHARERAEQFTALIIRGCAPRLRRRLSRPSRSSRRAVARSGRGSAT